MGAYSVYQKVLKYDVFANQSVLNCGMVVIDNYVDFDVLWREWE